MHPILIDGRWRDASVTGDFRAENPATRESLPDRYPISGWADCEAALTAAAAAARAMRALPGDRIAAFLDDYANRIEALSEALVEAAALETALPPSPRLGGVELPRTLTQLRQAATAARDQSWRLPTIDTETGIRSCHVAIGPVLVFGPNNFPFAFGSISGGDFAAAIAAGNPVIAKAHPLHPTTTRLFAEAAAEARDASDFPSGAIQLLYHIDHEDGLRMAADRRLGAIAYTGSRVNGLRLKAAADAAGTPSFLELSSVNPVVVLPGASRERGTAIAEEFVTSCLMGTGQFCTNPGLVVVVGAGEADAFITDVAAGFEQAPTGTLLSGGVADGLRAALETLQAAGATVVIGDKTLDERRYAHANTLLRTDGATFLANSHALQTEAFGNATLIVGANDVDQANDILETLEGNLTGCIYSAHDGTDDDAYASVAPTIAPRVGRLLNDKMPTGVAVSAAMHHGGPYPATGHPGFSAVGMPGSLRRFSMLQCYDNVRSARLPSCLADANPSGETWRWIDGAWTQASIGAGSA